jgi:hypothetical protein
MEISLKDIGPLRQADFALGDFTIICGRNNTGKTYATYALFGFLSYWREAFVLSVPDQVVNTLMSEGLVEVPLQPYIDNFKEILSTACKDFTPNLPIVMGGHEKNFAKARFCLEVEKKDIQPVPEFRLAFGSPKNQLFQISKDPNQDFVTISLLVERENVKISSNALSRIIGDALKQIIFGQIIPDPFIVCAERTGVAIFRNDLNFAWSQVFEQIKNTQEFNPLEVLDKAYRRQPLPVIRNVEFSGQLEEIAKRDSFIAKEYPQVLLDFGDLMGGEFAIGRDGLYFKPDNTKVRLTMKEGSSAIRSLLDIAFYLRHIAKKNHLLMIDEPELNLHPENQRKIARLLARLVNLGIKVYITTHSDYIVKELNTLIMLSSEKPSIKKLRETYGYKKEEMLSPERIRVYATDENKVLLNGHKNRTKILTFIDCDITHEMGINAKSFDPTILEMNRIQEAIILRREG